MCSFIFRWWIYGFRNGFFSFFLTIYFFQFLFGLFYPFSIWTFKPLFYPFSTYLVFSIPFLFILTFKSPIFLDFHSRPQSCRGLIVTTSFTCPSFVCTPYQNNAPQISQIETLIYLEPVLIALPIKKDAPQNFKSIDNDLFWTSFACTPYQKKMHPKFNMYRHRISEAERLMTASCPLHFTTFIFDLQFIYLPSILLISILFYSSIGFYYPFHFFSSLLFILIVV